MKHPLPELRNALIELHKALVDSERVSYEQTIGAITSPNHFLQLLTRDPWFAWLHELSELVVMIDETLDAKEPPSGMDADRFVAQARELIVPNENGRGFEKRYFEAMQRDPDVVLAHGRTRKLLEGLG